MMKQYYIGYWDLLGQKSIVNEIAKSADTISSHLQQKINVTGRALVSAIATLRQMYSKDDDKSNLVDVLKTNEPTIWKDLTRDEILASFRLLDCGIEQFSDSTLFFVEAGSRLSIPLLYYTCIVVGKLLPRMHACGLYPRGAIGFGEAERVVGGGIIGPILDRLARIESREAFYARIVVEKETRKRIHDIGEDKNSIEYSPVYANFLLSMIQIEPDGYWSINPLAKTVIADEKAHNIYSEFSLNVVNASRKLDASLNELLKEQDENRKEGRYSQLLVNARIIDKYIFLREYYRQRQSEMSKYGATTISGETFEDFAQDSNIHFGDYFVFYASFAPIHAKSALMMPVAMGTYVSLIKNIKKMLTLHSGRFYDDVLASLHDCYEKERFIADAKDVTIGVQQMASHLMIYVKNESELSLLIFVHILRAMSLGLINAVAADESFNASVCIGKGWELSVPCLQGPVIWEAYQMAQNTDRIGRMVVSEKILEHISNATLVVKCWPSIFECFAIATDGVLEWNFNTTDVKEDYDEVNREPTFENLMTAMRNNVHRRFKELTDASEGNDGGDASEWRKYMFWERSLAGE